MSISARHMYKEETGSFPTDEQEYVFTCWRSKGQWVIDISDEERLSLFGRESEISIMIPDTDYVLWLEEKVMQLIKDRK